MAWLNFTRGVVIFTALIYAGRCSLLGGDISPFIIRGNTARDGDFPWQLSFELRETGRWRHTCGATLIHENFALTASHCIFDPRRKNPDGSFHASRVSDMRVVAGAHRISPLDSDAETYYIRRVMTPYGFHGVFDLAVLELKVPANTTRSDISPIAIANHGEPVVGQLCTISGWGSQSSVRPRTSSTLREGRMTMVSLRDCRASGWSVFFLQICATGSPRQVTACFGDSGGPLSCVRKDGTPVLAGVSSFAYKRCGIARPNVFVRISVYRSWLRNLTNVDNL